MCFTKMEMKNQLFSTGNQGMYSKFYTSNTFTLLTEEMRRVKNPVLSSVSTATAQSNGAG